MFRAATAFLQKRLSKVGTVIPTDVSGLPHHNRSSALTLRTSGWYAI
jgi:hypothetical protein